MKALLTKYWRRLRFTDADRTRNMRAECLNVAARFQTTQVSDYLHNAKLVFEWWEHGKVPQPDSQHAGPTLQ